MSIGICSTVVPILIDVGDGFSIVVFTIRVALCWIT
jgi:hypothetical protein